MIRIKSGKSVIKTLLVSAFIVLLTACGGREFKKTPLDEFIVLYGNEQPYSIILSDMDVEGSFFKTYKHKYRIIRERDSVPFENETKWMEVSKDFFWKNEENLGMTILEKDRNGKISKVAAPPGYQYVGNPRYGEWRTHNGTSFWAFYGQYMFMSQMFGMINRPIYRRDYDTYYSGGYYGRRSYYGPKTGKNYKYGTNSPQTRKSNPNFFQRRASRSGWSSSRSRSGGRSRSSGFGK